eukprot:XP_025011544.1 uncharacterized protein LOC112533536 [Gallus gallus]
MRLCASIQAVHPLGQRVTAVGPVRQPPSVQPQPTPSAGPAALQPQHSATNKAAPAPPRTTAREEDAAKKMAPRVLRPSLQRISLLWRHPPSSSQLHHRQPRPQHLLHFVGRRRGGRATVPRVLEKSRPITAEQRPKREHMKKLAQEERQRAAHQMKIGPVQFLVQREIDMAVADDYGYLRLCSLSPAPPLQPLFARAVRAAPRRRRGTTKAVLRTAALEVCGRTAPGRGRGWGWGLGRGRGRCEEPCVSRTAPPSPSLPSAVGCGDLGRLKDSGPPPPQCCCPHPGRAPPSLQRCSRCPPELRHRYCLTVPLEKFSVSSLLLRKKVFGGLIMSGAAAEAPLQTSKLVRTLCISAFPQCKAGQTREALPAAAAAELCVPEEGMRRLEEQEEETLRDSAGPFLTACH